MYIKENRKYSISLTYWYRYLSLTFSDLSRSFELVVSWQINNGEAELVLEAKSSILYALRYVSRTVEAVCRDLQFWASVLHRHYFFPSFNLPPARIGHFRVTLCLRFKTSLGAIPFILKWVWFAWKWTCRKTHFHMNSCAWRLVLRQRQKATRKWPIVTHRFQFKFREFFCVTAITTERTFSGVDTVIRGNIVVNIRSLF